MSILGHLMIVQIRRGMLHGEEASFSRLGTGIILGVVGHLVYSSNLWANVGLTNWLSTLILLNTNIRTDTTSQKGLLPSRYWELNLITTPQSHYPFIPPLVFDRSSCHPSAK